MIYSYRHPIRIAANKDRVYINSEKQLIEIFGLPDFNCEHIVSVGSLLDVIRVSLDLLNNHDSKPTTTASSERA